MGKGLDPEIRAGGRQMLAVALQNTKNLDDASPGVGRGGPPFQRFQAAAHVFFSLLIEQQRRLPSQEQKWDEVEKEIDEAEKSFPDVPQFELLRRERSPRRTATTTLKDSPHRVGKGPKSVPFWNGLIMLSIRQKKWEQTEADLELFEKELGDSVDVRLAKGNYFLRRRTKWPLRG